MKPFVPDLRLLLVITVRPEAPLDPDQLRAALRGGVTLVQGRGKGFTTRELIDRYGALMATCAEHDVAFLVNDRPDLVLVLDAGGAHVGPEDLPPAAARRVLGERWLGVSARTGARLRAAGLARATYVGIGALRRSASKPDADAIGLSRIAELIRVSSVPAVVIGGVMPEDVPALRSIGAAGVAVSSGILDAPDPEAAARSYLLAMERG
jgi:thiamine-phosphate diphosphorylase